MKQNCKMNAHSVFWFHKKKELKRRGYLINLCDVYDYLPSDILVKLDRAAMYHSLETRAPLLDFRIAQAASKIPISLKIKKNGYKVTKKYMLKSILKDQVYLIL